MLGSEIINGKHLHSLAWLHLVTHLFSLNNNNKTIGGRGCEQWAVPFSHNPSLRIFLSFSFLTLKVSGSSHLLYNPLSALTKDILLNMQLVYYI